MNKVFFYFWVVRVKRQLATCKEISKTHEVKAKKEVQKKDFKESS